MKSFAAARKAVRCDYGIQFCVSKVPLSFIAQGDFLFSTFYLQATSYTVARIVQSPAGTES
ncbi:hypothetical protein [Ethanoligenens sp.]|uniref:hypothetical protein n=1 Tax=Ethanoligenens sp. TaxID=2099655 RepID=UPI0039ED8598